MTMAINSNGIRDTNTKSLCSTNTSNLSSCRLIKINYAGKDHIPNGLHGKIKINKDTKSPYLSSDKVQVLSRVTEKRLEHKNPVSCDFTSSFPLAVNVYKANSDEFKISKRNSKKVKKSVLTLPNAPVPVPKSYTVSDMNDSEYLKDTNDAKPNKPKKRRPIKRNKKFHIKDKETEFYDRDARYCSQLNINLDCSSTDLMNFTGDGRRGRKNSYKANNNSISNDPYDMWAVLRNINRLQFRPSPPASQYSIVPLRKRRPMIRKSNNRTDTRIIETCHTEEFAYISSFEIDSKSKDSYSPTSSFDRITVIDKKDEQDDIVPKFNMKTIKEHSKLGNKGKNNMSPKNKARLRSNYKQISGDKQKNCNVQQESNNILIHDENQVNTVETTEHLDFQTTTDIKSNPSIHLESIHSNCSIIKENKHIYSKIINNSHIVDQIGDNKVKSNHLKYVTKAHTAKEKIPYSKEESREEINGITKVILSKGRNTEPPQVELQKKSRLALTLPKTTLPKLTQTEIKRRLASLKFPIVVLEKDQLTNRAIHVPIYDPPQFNGLNEHIWPFMLDWPKEPQVEDRVTTKQTSKKGEYTNLHFKKRRQNVCLTEPKLTDVNLFDVKKADYLKNTISNLPSNRNTHIGNKESSTFDSKTKPIRLLQNKMLNFLHKHSSPTKVTEYDNRQASIIKIDKIVGTNEKLNNDNQQGNELQECILPNELNKRSVANIIAKKPFYIVKHPWAKTKWASDFIDSIIRKIKCGVYYGVDHRELKDKIKADVSTQTEKHILRNAFCQNETATDSVDSKLSINTRDDSLKKIPGFDNSLTTFEIETVTKNQITVKHCVTNVVVHFDVQVLAEANTMMHGDNSLSCLSVDTTEYPEKVFKCKTTILNSILPAELCSIIPTMMQNILNSNVTLNIPVKSVGKMYSRLPAVSELTGNEIDGVSIPYILPAYDVPEHGKSMMTGRFSVFKESKFEMNIRTECTSKLELESLTDLIPKVHIRPLLQFSYGPSDLQFQDKKELAMNTCNFKVDKPSNIPSVKQPLYCMSVQPYELQKHSLIASYIFDTRMFLKKLLKRLNSNIDLLLYSYPFKITCTCNLYTDCYKTLISAQSEERAMHLSINNFEILSLYSSFTKRNYRKENYDGAPQFTKIENNFGTHVKYEKCSYDHCKKLTTTRNAKKRSYVKRYRKCNSMSSISNYKSTPLSRVTNLDEFCQVLGSSSLCSVLDGCLDNKILSAVEEMRNYITDITPKQALLVLLLTSKKETSNLIRFKPVLLQGIAVNRITKAAELDTEIDVIEREKFNKFSQYEAFSSPTFTENPDKLLDELYWIAKTTASDYQKTFNESSEKLLKSLLEKRKKLNPSYLRVMARYVGLGLLKPLK